jgi:hypothetical protein
MPGKAKKIRGTLGLITAWIPSSVVASCSKTNPLAWLVGMRVDARWLPPELQAEARRGGLIPDLPLDQAA